MATKIQKRLYEDININKTVDFNNLSPDYKKQYIAYGLETGKLKSTDERAKSYMKEFGLKKDGTEKSTIAKTIAASAYSGLGESAINTGYGLNDLLNITQRKSNTGDKAKDEKIDSVKTKANYSVAKAITNNNPIAEAFLRVINPANIVDNATGITGKAVEAANQINDGTKTKSEAVKDYFKNIYNSTKNQLKEAVSPKSVEDYAPTKDAVDPKQYLETKDNIRYATGVAQAGNIAQEEMAKNTANKVFGTVGNVAGSIVPTILSGPAAPLQAGLQAQGGKTEEMLSTDDAKTLEEAQLKSLPYSLIGGAIEGVSGIGKVGGAATKASGKALPNIISNAIGEGTEEVAEGVVSNLFDKGLMLNKSEGANLNTPQGWFSTTDDRALINPMSMGQNFIGGAIGGTIYGGINQLAQNRANANMEKVLKATFGDNIDSKTLSPQQGTINGVAQENANNAQNINQNFSEAQNSIAQTPNVGNVQTPNVQNVQTPNINNVQTPNTQNIQVPNVQNIQSPNINNVQSPNLQNIQNIQTQNVETPNIQNVQTPNAQNVQTENTETQGLQIPQVPNTQIERPIDINKEVVPREAEDKFVNTVMNSDYIHDETKQTFENMLDSTTHTQVSNVESTREAVDYINSQVGQTYQEKLLRAKEDFLNGRADVKVQDALGIELVRELGNQGDYEGAAQLLVDVKESSSIHARELQILSMLKAMKPESQAIYVKKCIDKFNQANPDRKIEYTEAEQTQVLKSLKEIDAKTEADLEELKQYYLDNGDYNFKFEKKMAEYIMKNEEYSLEEIKTMLTKQVMGKIFDKADSKLLKQVSTYQVISHLLNTSTALRNHLSNKAYAGVEHLCEKIAKQIHSAEFHNNKGFADLDSATKQANKAKAKSTRNKTIVEILAGTDRVDSDRMLKSNQSTVDRNSKVFNNKFLNTMEKALSIELKAPDEYAKELARQDRIAQWKESLSKSEYEQWKDEIESNADEWAKFVTFQDDNYLTNAMQSFKNFLNGKQDFGAGDLLLKYTKTPTNVVLRQLDFTPVGLAKYMYHYGKAKSDLTPFEQRQISMDLANCLVGTTGATIGAMLGALGIIATDDEEDENIKKMLKDAGISGTTINTTQLFRTLAQDGASEIQDEDVLLTFDWLQPISSNITNGAILYNKLKRGASFTETSFDLIQNVLDFPCNQSISTILNEVEQNVYNDQGTGTAIFYGVATALGDSISGFVPSPVRHLSNAIDPVTRNVYSDEQTTDLGTILEQTGKKTIRNIPFASKTLDPKLRSDGEEMVKSDFGFFGNLALQASPLRATQVKKIEGSDKLIELATASDGTKELEKKITPVRYAPNKTQYETKLADKGIALTPEQKKTYMQAYGELYSEYVVPLIEQYDYSRMSDYEKQKATEIIADKHKEVKKSAEWYAFSYN